VLWVATGLGCLRVDFFGLITRGLTTQDKQSVNNPTRVAKKYNLILQNKVVIRILNNPGCLFGLIKA